MSTFPENSSSALQIYCHQEGVKVITHTNQSYLSLRVHSVSDVFISVQDVIIPELMKKLDILGDNGVS